MRIRQHRSPQEPPDTPRPREAPAAPLDKLEAGRKREYDHLAELKVFSRVSKDWVKKNGHKLIGTTWVDQMRGDECRDVAIRRAMDALIPPPTSPNSSDNGWTYNGPQIFKVLTPAEVKAYVRFCGEAAPRQQNAAVEAALRLFEKGRRGA